MKKVFQGAREVFDIDLGVKDTCTGSDITRPFDLTGFVPADSKICWRAGTTQIEKAFDDPDVAVIGVDTAGMVQGILDIDETASFPKDEVGDIEILIDKGAGDITRFQVLDGFQVIGKICA